MKLWVGHKRHLMVMNEPTLTIFKMQRKNKKCWKEKRFRYHFVSQVLKNQRAPSGELRLKPFFLYFDLKKKKQTNDGKFVFNLKKIHPQKIYSFQWSINL